LRLLVNNQYEISDYSTCIWVNQKGYDF